MQVDLSSISSGLEAAVDGWLEGEGFKYGGPLLRGRLYSNEGAGVAVMLDHGICNPETPYTYREYTREQNRYMHEYRSVYRFLVEDVEDFNVSVVQLDRMLHENPCEGKIVTRGASRDMQAIDPTRPEALFEDAFIDVYGREALDKLEREFPIIDIEGHTRWIDYVINRKDFRIAIEENGETYHHPVLIGKKRYNSQLLKQNSIVAGGDKVFRWSIESMKFKDEFRDHLRIFFGDPGDFISIKHCKARREFRLFEHQEGILDAISSARDDGKNTFLVVLPTGTGKTEILLADFASRFRKEPGTSALFLVPSVSLKTQLVAEARKRAGYYGYTENIGDEPGCQVMVKTYAWMSRNYHMFTPDAFDYVAIDEAHHAVAPTVKKVIQHFVPSSLIGLTATDQRLDTRRLEDIFGEYDTSMSLKEAIEKDIVVPISAYRLRSNLDLSEIRYNGKDYVSTDLQRTVIVPSRDQLIVDLLEKYFVVSGMPFKSGLIFCVSIKHAESMAKRLRDRGISAQAVSGKESRSARYIEEYQEGKIQFLTTCSLLTEGWDSPRTSIVVMARPTMSKVLYTQQLGRGTRKYPGKESLYVIDVVDNYGPQNAPWSIHALLGGEQYRPWSDVINPVKGDIPGEEVILAGLYEHERALEQVDIFTFESVYPDHLSEEQLARDLFISTGTLKSWIKKGRVVPDVVIPCGSRKLNYFAPGQVDGIMRDLGLKVHDETTQYTDFREFVDKGDYTYSYKMIFILALLDVVDANGECDLDELTSVYRSFYLGRLQQGLPVDRSGSPYNRREYLDDSDGIKRSILANPFEKFERKRFMYHCRDLNRISFAPGLWSRINNPEDLDRVRRKMTDDLESYYEGQGGVPDVDNVMNTTAWAHP